MPVTVYSGGALVDARSESPELDQSIVVEDGTITSIGPTEDEPSPGSDEKWVDAGGSCFVPGMVDAHSHVTLPGGSHWIERIYEDDTAELLGAAERNGELGFRSGVRWMRDVGSPRRNDRALALTVRDSWAHRRDRPYLRAAGTWLAAGGVLPPGTALEAKDSDQLQELVVQQIEDGADLIKLYLDGPDRDVAPWTASEVNAAVTAAVERGIPVTAHATLLPGARSAVEGGVHCIEHGFTLDESLAREMARRGTFLVSTMAIFDSWKSFASTTTLPRFVEDEGRHAISERRETAVESLRVANAAGVQIAAGTDFGGGSLRANQMAWEVEAMVIAGLEPWQALASATWRGGDLLGEPRAGRIEVGGPADFFLVHGNPLDDPSALWRVWLVV